MFGHGPWSVDELLRAEWRGVSLCTGQDKLRAPIEKCSEYDAAERGERGVIVPHTRLYHLPSVSGASDAERELVQTK